MDNGADDDDVGHVEESDAGTAKLKATGSIFRWDISWKGEEKMQEAGHDDNPCAENSAFC